ncbi:hypothetical protein NDU88_000809 [Pleurodeles waltl]|uniref:Uncharacterized protein n=1 Tax=Pleurodeles waltl TaxID=8319 RepID=A0AAV7KYV4_PLEWA|nr:hypothetical protein NDU88_000809 [Pleurodeles waltl]
MGDVIAPTPICLIVSFLGVHQERDVLVDSTSYGHKNRTPREKWFQGLIWTSRHAFMVFDGLRYMGVCVNDTNCRIVPVTGGQYYSALVGVGSIQLAGFSSGAAEGNAPVRYTPF